MKIAALTTMLVLALASRAATADDVEVRAFVERFVAAQNAHDIRAVGDLLWDSPEFLWVSRGTAIWGRDAALTRFEALYKGTWRLEPAMGDLRVVRLADGVAEIHVPIVFTIGAAGQPAQTTRFLMNQVLLRTGAGWKIASILPMAAP
jgi:ketosteroid isomerase-like protein